MLRVEHGTGLFPLSGGFVRHIRCPVHRAHLCTSQNRTDNRLNRKRSREAAYRLHDTVNRGMVQSIRADGRYFTNQASIGFLT